VSLVVADAELPLDDLGDPGAGPDLASRAIGLRPVPEEFRDRTPLCGREPWRGPRRGSRPERLGAVVPGVGQPAASRPFRSITTPSFMASLVTPWPSGEPAQTDTRRTPSIR
jgi:hypothetical protein